MYFSFAQFFKAKGLVQIFLLQAQIFATFCWKSGTLSLYLLNYHSHSFYTTSVLLVHKCVLLRFLVTLLYTIWWMLGRLHRFFCWIEHGIVSLTGLSFKRWKSSWTKRIKNIVLGLEMETSNFLKWVFVHKLNHFKWRWCLKIMPLYCVQSKDKYINFYIDSITCIYTYRAKSACKVLVCSIWLELVFSSSNV